MLLSQVNPKQPFKPQNCATAILDFQGVIEFFITAPKRRVLIISKQHG